MGRSKRALAWLLALGALWLPLSAYADELEPDPAAPPEASRTETLDDAAEMRGQANSELSEVQGRIEALSDVSTSRCSPTIASSRRSSPRRKSSGRRS